MGSSPTVTTRLELFSVAPRSARVGGTSLYKLYGYVQPHLKGMVLELFWSEIQLIVGCRFQPFRSANLKMGIDFTETGLDYTNQV